MVGHSKVAYAKGLSTSFSQVGGNNSDLRAPLHVASSRDCGVVLSKMEQAFLEKESIKEPTSPAIGQYRAGT
jgi:hypothetical protein